MKNVILLPLIAFTVFLPLAKGVIQIPTELVGDPGNPPDAFGHGDVDYEYYIGIYEVTNEQYAAFLNAVAATDPHGLYYSGMASYGITQSGSSGSLTYLVNSGWENKPVNYVSFWDACRFANWLTTGDTETGVYNLTNAGITNNTVTRDATAWSNGGVAIASLSEWHKAAYYNGSPTGGDGDGYWLYPTQANTAPTVTGPNNTDANSANYDLAVGSFTIVGSYTAAMSYYGTFDQGGNAYEWIDEIEYTAYRGLRGGSFAGVFGLQSTNGSSNDPSKDWSTYGFRVTSLQPIPPPNITVTLEMSTDGSTWSAIEPGQQTVVGPVAHFRASISPIDSVNASAANPVTVNFSPGGGTVDAQLMSSSDMSGWTSADPGNHASGNGKFFRVETDSAFSLIPAGTFTMGSPEDELGRGADETQHPVTLTRLFYLQQTEVTKTQWDEVRADGPLLGYSDLPEADTLPAEETGDHPALQVSWYDVVKWLNLKSEIAGLTPCYTVDGFIYKTGEFSPVCNFNANGYRLPSESEWEYACRAGTATAFYNGPITYEGTNPVDPNLDIIGWFAGNSWQGTQSVGQKLPNDWGLYDMSGNVSEWCWDFYDTYSGDTIDPIGPSDGLSGRVVRGGRFGNSARDCRSANRYNWPGAMLGGGIGFRPARTTSMVFVEGGTFIMNDEVTTFDPITGVEISYTQRSTTVSSFYIGTREMTVGKWNHVRDWANANGYDIITTTVGCSDSHPVDDIYRENIYKWCNALSEMENLEPVYYTDSSQTTVYKTGTYEITNFCVDWEGNGYRLPTEAEWEFAARGGNHSEGYLFSGSSNAYEVGWFWENTVDSDCAPDWVIEGGGSQGPQLVGQLLPNELNIYDMSGNVNEYCWDFTALLGTEPVDNPRGPDHDPGTGQRILRGGSWLGGGENPLFDGSDRWVVTPAVSNQFGFRIARNAQS